MPTPPSAEEIANWQRWFAMESNNRAWQLIEKAERTPAETDELIHTAHAAALCWSKVGTELNVARAEMLLGTAHGLAGNGALALRHSTRSLDYFTAHECPDWELAFAHAAMASASHAAGDHPMHARYYGEAARLGEAIVEAEDREIFLQSFRQIPGV